MQNELKKRKEHILTQLDEAKKERGELNALASEWSSKRNELNTKAWELVKKAHEMRKERDLHNKLVSEYKMKRGELNAQVREMRDKLDYMRRDRDIVGGKSLDELKREIDALEFRQQTEVLKLNEERKLIEHIEALRKEFRNKKEMIEKDESLSNLMRGGE